MVTSDDDGHFEDIELTVDGQDISINHHDLIFAYLMKSAQYELEYDKLLVAAKHGIYVQLLRMVPDVIEGLVQLEDVDKYAALLRKLHFEMHGKRLMDLRVVNYFHQILSVEYARNRAGLERIFKDTQD